MTQQESKNNQSLSQLSDILLAAAEILSNLHTDSIEMQSTINDHLAKEKDPLAALLSLQQLDFQSQMQSDLAALLKKASAELDAGTLDCRTLVQACQMQATKDLILKSCEIAARDTAESGTPTFF